MNKRIAVHVMHKSVATSVGIHALLIPYQDFAAQMPDSRTGGGEAPDVVITDYDRGIELAHAHRDGAGAGAAPKVLVVTERIKEWDIRSALDAGVRGVLHHDCDADELAQAIRCLDRGNVHLSAPLERLATRSMHRSRLTAREREVLQLLGQGCCNKLIARALGIAEITAKIHLQSLMRKLEATTRTHAVAIAMELGLMPASLEPTVSLASQQRGVNHLAFG